MTYEAFSFLGTAQVAVEVSVNQQFNLVAKEELEDVKPFKKARYVKSKGATKGSYIVFYVWDVQKNSTVRRRLPIPSQYKTEAEKKAYAKDRIKKIDNLLKSGYHIDRRKSKAVELKQKQKQERRIEKYYLVSEAADEVVKLKELAQNFDKGIAFYKSRLKQLTKWLEDNNEDCLLDELSYTVLRDFFAFKMRNEVWSAKTFNLTLTALKTFYNDCIREEWATAKNPFGKFKKLPEDYGEKNKPYTDDQIVELKAYIQEHDPYLWTIINFTYYAFLRGTEMMRLKVEDIDLRNDLIWVSGRQSKTKKKEVIPIAPSLRSVIDEMELHRFRQGHYLLSRYERPSDEKMGPNFIGKRFIQI